MAGDIFPSVFSDKVMSSARKNTRIVNVVEYGAHPGGTEDSTNAILAAIAEVAPTGGVVFFPRGTYLISDILILGNGTETALSTINGVRLMGSGVDSTTIKWGVSAYGGPLVQINGICHGNDVSDLTLDGAGISGTIGLSIYSGQHGHFENLRAVNCDICIQLTTLSSIPSGATGNSLGNVFGKVFTQPNPGTSTTQTYGVWMTGYDTTTGDTNQTVFALLTNLIESDYQTGLRLGFADFNIFLQLINFVSSSSTGTVGVHLDGSVVSGFPANNRFLLADFATAPLVTGTPGLNFAQEYDTTDGAAAPPNDYPYLFGTMDNPGGAAPKVPFGIGREVNVQSSLANYGVPITTADNILAVTTPVEGTYLACLYLRVTAAATVSAAAFTGDETGTQFFNFLAQNGSAAAVVLNAEALAVGSYSCIPIILRYAKGAAQAPTIQLTCSVVDAVYATASLLKIE